MDADRMAQMRDMANGLDPDLIVFTGDQMDRRNSDAERFVEGFAGISAPMGVWGILGNHDHFIDPKRSEWALEAAGIQPLVNSAVTFERSGASLALIGIEDLLAREGRAPDFSILAKYPASFRLCLCHQPQGWHRAATAGAHLTLSGHTHGGQIALTGRNLNVARFSTRYIAGPYRRDEAFLYVSRGVGVGAVPVRVGAPPEIDLLTLRAAAVSARVAA
jgi:predicted MPP superfamily phosphohydrolase